MEHHPQSASYLAIGYEHFAIGRNCISADKGNEVTSARADSGHRTFSGCAAHACDWLTLYMGSARAIEENWYRKTAEITPALGDLKIQVDGFLGKSQSAYNNFY